MLIVRWLALFLLLASAVCFGFYVGTDEAFYKRLGLVILKVDDHRRCRLLCGGSLRAIALTTQHHNGAGLYSRLLRGVLMR